MCLGRFGRASGYRKPPTPAFPKESTCSLRTRRKSRSERTCCSSTRFSILMKGNKTRLVAQIIDMCRGAKVSGPYLGVDRTGNGADGRFVEVWHYARGGSNTATHLHGLFRRDSDILLGIAWWIPPKKSAAHATFPENWRRVPALSRLCCTDQAPKNSESFLLSKSVMLIVKTDPRWRCLVTYADSWGGHTGTIYKAIGWKYWGMTTPETVYTKDGVTCIPCTAYHLPTALWHVSLLMPGLDRTQMSKAMKNAHPVSCWPKLPKLEEVARKQRSRSRGGRRVHRQRFVSGGLNPAS
jgi:hypothetical protein